MILLNRLKINHKTRILSAIRIILFYFYEFEAKGSNIALKDQNVMMLSNTATSQIHICNIIVIFPYIPCNVYVISVFLECFSQKVHGLDKIV